MLNADLTVSKYSKDFQKRLSLQISLGRPRCDRGQRWCGQYCQVTLNFCNICNNVANIVVNVIRLSSGEKLGVLSQGPGIVYDVKMVGLKVEKNEWIAINCFQNNRGRCSKAVDCFRTSRWRSKTTNSIIIRFFQIIKTNIQLTS